MKPSHNKWKRASHNIPVFICWCQICMSFSHSRPDSYCTHVILYCFTYPTNLLVSVTSVDEPISCQWINAKNLIVAWNCISIISLCQKDWGEDLDNQEFSEHSLEGKLQTASLRKIKQMLFGKGVQIVCLVAFFPSHSFIMNSRVFTEKYEIFHIFTPNSTCCL